MSSLLICSNMRGKYSSSCVSCSAILTIGGLYFSIFPATNVCFVVCLMVSHEKKKINSKPQDLDFQEIPFKLREIMRSKMEMQNPKKKRKRMPEKQGPQNAELQTEIQVPKFKKRKRESVGAYLNRMDQETKHVMFLSKNQPDREPENELDIPDDGTTKNEKSKKKKAFDRRRLDKILRKKEEKRESILEKEMFKDEVKFGEVVMQPPSFTSKPRKSAPQSKAGEKSLLLKKLFDKGSAVTKVPTISPARQRLMEEERGRVVQAYRDLKKKQLEQSASNKHLYKAKS
ncbi:coiled-coil domain-containing protein 137 [Bombina bombina]|uniref:coiled-coil domain-containing protein 137 n=1 Tax=Bombina bombina TaxID=8345 RepID=UPI00235A78F7|nr:coiled-coil domain-containing protein 137 [Bombina bombina]